MPTWKQQLLLVSSVYYFLGLFLLLGVTASKKQKPNIVFLVCESTDGRTWQKGYQNNVIPLPNLRALEEAAGGYSFHRNYANSPVCCTSRSSFWSGRHAHKIPHVQVQKHTNSQSGKTNTQELPVDGVWNNFEGLPHDFEHRIDQILETYAGYETYISGKTDWSTGGHSRNVQLSAWTMYTRFPYNVHETGGWRLEEPYICADNGTVIPGNRSAHGSDWHTLKETVQWIRDYPKNETTKDKPFFVYQGMSIVHPPYRTNEQYYNKIDPAKIRVPAWPKLNDMHPCDFQSSMLKGCIPPLNNATARQQYYSKYRRRNIRRIYYAMIAEFDAMVGAYMQAIQDIGEWDNTIFIVTSDHGDLQMEHQQSYKQVPYDASSSVPLVIYDGRRGRLGNHGDPHTTTTSSSSENDKPPQDRVIDVPTQLIDLYPTIMELVGVNSTHYPVDRLDGHSLVPLMTMADDDEPSAKNTKVLEHSSGSTTSTARPDYVVSQFHGMNIGMSWFLVVRRMPCVNDHQNHPHPQMVSQRDSSSTNKNNKNKNNKNTQHMCAMKLVIWGTGHEVDSQLFDLTHDPDEMTNLIHQDTYKLVRSALERDLRSVVDYPRVALDVAKYNRESMKHWIDVMGEPDWRHNMHHNLRWDASWDVDSAGAFQALEEWLNGTVEILPCRSDLVWPPASSASSPL